MRRTLTIAIVGAGGDGVVVLGTFLQKLAAQQGYYSQMPRYYGAQIRGGASAVKLGLDAERLSLPEDTADVLVCFDWDRYQELSDELPLRDDTLVLYDKPPKGINLPNQSFLVDFTKKSQDVTGSTLNKNMVALGLLERILAFPPDQIKQTIDRDEELFLLKDNLAVIEAGEYLFSEFPLPELELSPAKNPSPKVVLHGNKAMARGAIHAGCSVFFGYPITPASEIMQEMQGELNQGRGVFLQAEDEITAAGLCIGASLVGEKSLTATSGPGLDLMTEMMGLASAAELPMVIIDVQRCGPSTGIPSKSEQSDLNHAIYGGHGDAPRVIIAPYDIEGCYRLVMESIDIAQHFQTPVILLSDQWLGQTLVATDRDFLEKDYLRTDMKRPVGEERTSYHRYKLTEDFISPMAVAGEEGLIYQTTGLAHNEMGVPAFNFQTHQRMHEKRWGKLLPLCHRHNLVKLFGGAYCKTGIITWGSSAQIVLKTVRDLGLQEQIKVCIPELVHPLPNKVGQFLQSIEKLLVIEMNYSGQFYRYLRSQVDLPVKTRVVARAGGRPFSEKEPSQPITELVQ
ncbi:2-oxoacid:acceptor oxidoreductase subunit alpha [Chloroflexota bacterium]